MNRPQYRMIAIDLDGTLLSPEHQVTERTRQAVQRALAAGILVCFATGRNWTESRTVLDAVAHYDTAVFAGGAMVIDTRNQVLLHRTRMQPELAREVCGVMEGDGHAVLALQAHDGGGVDYLITDGAPLNEATRRWMAAMDLVIHHVPSLGDYPHEQTVRVGIVADRDEVARTTEKLDGKFKERILCQCLPVPAARVDVLEVFDPAVNKWEGVLFVARRHGVEPHQIIAIGDEINDLPMIRSAGLGVAMGNARPEVQVAAKCVIGSNAEEGLARFLEEIVDEHLVEAERGGDRRGVEI